jgi:hypothetical protein
MIAHFWSLFRARAIQSMPSHPIFLRSILLLSSHLRLVFLRLSEIIKEIFQNGTRLSLYFISEETDKRTREQRVKYAKEKSENQLKLDSWSHIHLVRHRGTNTQPLYHNPGNICGYVCQRNKLSEVPYMMKFYRKYIADLSHSDSSFRHLNFVLWCQSGKRFDSLLMI